MAETIGKVLLTYDVDDKHNEIKEELKKLGYADEYRILPTNTTKTLPESTLWHPEKQVSEAIKDLGKICNDLDVVLENAFATLTKDEVQGYNKE